MTLLIPWVLIFAELHHTVPENGLPQAFIGETGRVGTLSYSMHRRQTDIAARMVSSQLSKVINISTLDKWYESSVVIIVIVKSKHYSPLLKVKSSQIECNCCSSQVTSQTFASQVKSYNIMKYAHSHAVVTNFNTIKQIC